MQYRPFIAPALSAALVATTLAAASAPAVQHVRGTLSAVRGSTITVTTASGPVSLTVGPKTHIISVVPASADDIKPGVFIGTANVPSASGAPRALEVVVFPAAMNGTGEGDYAWDLGPGKSSSMTNGTVAGPKCGSMMTNATVTRMSNGSVKTVTLRYAGGTKQVAIGAGIPIVRAAPGSAALLVRGAKVVAAPGAGSSAAVVIVGEKGATPPM